MRPDLLEAPPMVEEKPKTQSVKLTTDVVEAARIIVAIRNDTITDLLSDILRPIVLKMRDEEISKVYKPPKGK